MMRLLLTVTLAYVATLVVVLASSLIAILTYLRRIGQALDDARIALMKVNEATELLAPPIQGLNDVLENTNQSLSEAARDLEGADEHLTTVIDQSKAGQQTR